MADLDDFFLRKDNRKKSTKSKTKFTTTEEVASKKLEKQPEAGSDGEIVEQVSCRHLI